MGMVFQIPFELFSSSNSRSGVCLSTASLTVTIKPGTASNNSASLSAFPPFFPGRGVNPTHTHTQIPGKAVELDTLELVDGPDLTSLNVAPIGEMFFLLAKVSFPLLAAGPSLRNLSPARMHTHHLDPCLAVLLLLPLLLQGLDSKGNRNATFKITQAQSMDIKGCIRYRSSGPTIVDLRVVGQQLCSDSQVPPSHFPFVPLAVLRFAHVLINFSCRSFWCCSSQGVLLTCTVCSSFFPAFCLPRHTHTHHIHCSVTLSLFLSVHVFVCLCVCVRVNMCSCVCVCWTGAESGSWLQVPRSPQGFLPS